MPPSLDRSDFAFNAQYGKDELHQHYINSLSAEDFRYQIWTSKEKRGHELCGLSNKKKKKPSSYSNPPKLIPVFLSSLPHVHWVPWSEVWNPSYKKCHWLFTLPVLRQLTEL